MRPLHANTAADVLAWFVAQPLNTTAMIQATLLSLGPSLPSLPHRAGDSASSAAWEASITEGDQGRYGPIAWARSRSLLWLIEHTRPEVGLRRAGRGYLGWCPFHDDTAPQADGKPGTASLYVYCDPIYGWRWKCLSPNCGAWQGKVKDQFDWLVWYSAGSTIQSLELADTLEDPMT